MSHKLPSLSDLISDIKNIKIPNLSEIVAGALSMLPRTPWGYIAFALMAAGTFAAALRFYFGLGATTGMNDQFPWAMWIAFDFAGIGLAAAGFTIVAAVYIFNAKKYAPLVRPAILTALTGYSLVVYVLVIDLGLPLNAWHPLIMWNPHSVMFEITWCLILYTTVLVLEFAPIVLEKFNVKAPIPWIHAISVPMMIAGIILSTLHQSSFGSLYLIVPNRMHELWYSPLLPILFFISCISMGIAMMIYQTIVLAARKGIKLISDELRGNLAKIVVTVLAIYLLVRFFDILQDSTGRGAMALEAMKSLSYHSTAFYVEIIVGFVAPMVLLLIPKIRSCASCLYKCTIMIFLGFAANRMNTVVTSLEKYGNPDWMYSPTLIEILVTLGIGALAFTISVLVPRFLPIYETSGHD
jgi:Ni/Fe-hydrogenase subunit HybB-like protein